LKKANLAKQTFQNIPNVEPIARNRRQNNANAISRRHLSPGHSHPDANSFILFSHGSYLTGDSGYAGVPMTEHHNTLLIDGKGQGNEGQGHDAWDATTMTPSTKCGSLT
jgi:hypothetical protein